MRLYDVDGNINAWLWYLLTNRTIKVVVDGKDSDSVTIDFDISQGTVLSPSAVLAKHQRSLRCSESKNIKDQESIQSSTIPDQG